MYTLKSYDHDGYNRLPGEFAELSKAVERAVQAASNGDNRYSLHVRILINGKPIFDIHPEGIRELKEVNASEVNIGTVG